MSKSKCKRAGSKIPGSFYERPNSRFIYYKLNLGGGQPPFRCPTPYTTKKEAEANKRGIHEASILEINKRRQESVATMTVSTIMETFGDAVEEYWQTHGRNLNGGTEGARNERDYLDWLLRPDRIGAKRKLSEIDGLLVKKVVTDRRGEEKKRGVNRRTGKPILVKGERVSNATVNRSVLQPLRRVCRFARIAGVAMAEIAWEEYRLREPKERVREMEDHEQILLEDGLREDYRLMLMVGCVQGFRTSEQRRLKWDDCLWNSNRFRLRGRKGHDRAEESYVPMAPQVRELLLNMWSTPGRHPEYVFTWVSTKNDPYRGHRNGERYPYTKSGWRSAWKRACAKAGIKNLRYYDASRHTAGSRGHRVMGLGMVQDLLGHSSPETTRRYAHVRDDDIRAGLEKAMREAAERQAALRQSGTVPVTSTDLGTLSGHILPTKIKNIG